MGVNTSGWGLSQESDNVRNAETEDGLGGGNLPIWEADRITKLTTLATVSFTNKSSFSIPNGIVEDSSFQVGIENGGEKRNGINVVGMTMDADGKPLTGTVYVAAGGGYSYTKTVSGSFQASSPPPIGVHQGGDITAVSPDLRFSPSINGLDYVNETITFTFDAGKIQYGEVNGTITDYNGYPVPDVSVAGVGAADITDGQGEYRLVAPGGSNVPLTTFLGTYSFDVNLGPGEKFTKDIKYPQLTIRVLDADFEPVENAPVEIDGTAYHTEKNGKVEIPTAEVRNYEVTVMDTFHANDISVTEAGTEFAYTVGPGATFGNHSDMSIGGVKLNAVDAETGESITQMSAHDRLSGVRSLSGGNGVCKLLSAKTGEEVDIILGTGDKRYRSERVTGQMPTDSMLEVDVKLEPQTQVTNT